MDFYYQNIFFFNSFGIVAYSNFRNLEVNLRTAAIIRILFYRNIKKTN